jgi:hypothetical protein
MLSQFILRLTGMPSPAKERLVDALESAGLFVDHSPDTTPAPSARPRVADFQVHAETDLEAWLEPRLLKQTRAAAKAADLVIAVDWESTAHSVHRIIDLAASRGMSIGEKEAV